MGATAEVGGSEMYSVYDALVREIHELYAEGNVGRIEMGDAEYYRLLREIGHRRAYTNPGITYIEVDTFMGTPIEHSPHVDGICIHAQPAEYWNELEA